MVKFFMKILCPTCKAVTTWAENPWRPFCSERCKLIDLGRWAAEEYRIPGRSEERVVTKEVEGDNKAS